MHRIDVSTLRKALAAYKKLSSARAAEIAALQLQHGWKAAALHAARKCQQIALNLPDTSLAPCELKAEKVGGLGPEIWLADPQGIDEHRWLSASTLRSLLRLGLSRYEPSPTRAIEAEQERRKALDVAEAQAFSPSDDAA